jgi:hypothetical protein
MLALLTLLGTLDFSFVHMAYYSTLTKGASVQLVFGFEVWLLIKLSYCWIWFDLLYVLIVRNTFRCCTQYIDEICAPFCGFTKRESLGRQSRLFVIHRIIDGFLESHFVFDFHYNYDENSYVPSLCY